MFFGRRKHAAPAPVAPAPATPELTDELIFAAVQRTLHDVFGDDGEWTVARRSDEQTDQIFHEVLVHSLATAVTASVSAARVVLDGVSAVPADDALAGGPLGLLRAPRTNPWLQQAPADGEIAALEVEPAALSWEPAPITRWADLKRPVTGPVATVNPAAAEEKAA
ncbi:hypothetical protein ACFOYW_04400 [Gryllotalpicola reticulitermitis]|uniref:Uncharacterized protein n=1 Tax=Gryllotalpicola reticulitermitis TaxID=1184153 RepID=A0ABV8Q2K1_9MICO